jgi:hypothetical protein
MHTYIHTYTEVFMSPSICMQTTDMYGFHVYNRMVGLQELQLVYRQGVASGVPLIQGKLAETAASTVQLEIKPYVRETVSLMPPLIWQSRGVLKPCDNADSSYTADLERVIASQFKSKCSTSYSCNYPYDRPVNYVCVDRTVADGSGYWDRGAIQMIKDQVYPEILYMFTAPFVYRDGDLRGTSTWIDVRTRSVGITNIFYTPGQRIGTKLQVDVRFD